MTRYLKYITIIVISFVMMIGINVKADEEYQMYNGRSEIKITIPIHKTDSDKNPLEKAEFTLKDFNNNVSYKSEDKRDGDYLIDVYKYSDGPVWREDMDNEYRIEDYTSDFEALDEIFNIIPTKYSNIFKNAENIDDLFELLQLPSTIFYSNSPSNYNVGFYIPLIVEENKVPTGYKENNIIVPAFVNLSINNSGRYIFVYASLIYSPGDNDYSQYEMIPAYFEYKEDNNYEEIFDKINNNLSPEMNTDELIELFEDNGAIVDKDCELYETTIGPTRREDLEGRFDEEIEGWYCCINLIDERIDDEKEEPIIVNPETAGTIGIVTLLIVFSITTIVAIKKLKNN